MGGVVAAAGSLAEGWICCQYKAFFIHKDYLRSVLYMLIKERFILCFFVSWNEKNIILIFCMFFPRVCMLSLTIIFSSLVCDKSVSNSKFCIFELLV
jgi:cytochrome c oxidase subunit IV